MLWYMQTISKVPETCLIIMQDMSVTDGRCGGIDVVVAYQTSYFGGLVCTHHSHHHHPTHLDRHTTVLRHVSEALEIVSTHQSMLGHHRNILETNLQKVKF